MRSSSAGDKGRSPGMARRCSIMSCISSSMALHYRGEEGSRRERLCASQEAELNSISQTAVLVHHFKGRQSSI